MIKLMSSNYSIWKWKMWDLLYCKNLFKPVKGMTKPKGMSDDDWEILHTRLLLQSNTRLTQYFSSYF